MFIDPNLRRRPAAQARSPWPSHGRFVQADPIGYEDGMNLYSYVGGDPVNFTDPSGLCRVGDDPCVVTAPRQDGGGRGSGLGTFGYGFGNGAAPSGNRGETSEEIVVTGQRIRRRQRTSGSTGSGGPLEPAEDSRQPRLICSGYAYVLAGNPRTIGRTGGFLGPVRAGSAAIIPRQFTGQLRAGPVMRGMGATAWGYTGRGQTFEGFTDTVGHRALGTAERAQNIIMARASGRLVVELVSGRHEGFTRIILDIPETEHGCPQGTNVLMRIR